MYLILIQNFKYTIIPIIGFNKVFYKSQTSNTNFSKIADDTIPQIKVFSHFLLKYFRFNYQLLWEQKDQTAYVNFPHVLTETELLPFIIKTTFKHSFYKDFTAFPTSYFENIILNPDFIIEQSETSDSRPYLTTVNISPFNTHIVQETFDNDDNVIHHQPTTPQPPPHITRDTTEFIQDTLANLHTTSTIIDSNALQIPTHDITENTNNLFHQQDPSTLSTINTVDTQPLQTRHRQNYDPPPPSSENSTHSTLTHSPQHGSSNTIQTREHTLTQPRSQPNTPPGQSTQTILYIPAQPSISQNTNPVLTINTLHTNPITNTTFSRTLSRPPLSLFQNNPLSYNLTSNNFHSQPSSNTTQYNANIQPSSTQFCNPIPPTTIQTSPHIHPISIQPQTNTLNMPQNSFF